MRYCFGIDVGGTTVKCGLFEVTGTKESAVALLDKWEITTDKSDSGANIIKDIAHTIHEKMCECGLTTRDIAGIGIGVPGPVLNRRIVNACVNLGWGVCDVAAIFTEEFEKVAGNLPEEASVIIENDANIAALGEYASGGGKGYNSLVMVTLGTGVGGGVVMDGKIISGATGAAGEIGHMPVVYDEIERCNCGKCGCLEQVASATGIVRVAKKRVSTDVIAAWTNGETLTAKMIFDAMKNGDAAAEAVIDEVCEYLATAISHISCVINPEAIVIGGGVSKAGEVLINKISKYYKEKAFSGCKDTVITLAGLSNDAGIYGAAAMCVL